MRMRAGSQSEAWYFPDYLEDLSCEELVAIFLDRLPPLESKILSLRLQGRKVNEIAHLVGKSKSTVSVTCAQAVMRASEILRELGVI